MKQFASFIELMAYWQVQATLEHGNSEIQQLKHIAKLMNLHSSNARLCLRRHLSYLMLTATTQSLLANFPSNRSNGGSQR